MIKRIPKILKLVFVLIFLFQMIGLAILFAWPAITQAADINFQPQVTIPSAPGDSFKFNAGQTVNIQPNTIGNYIRLVYKYAIGIVGILAAIVLMIGGFMWLMAAGNPSKISEAQEWIRAALTGLILALGSYMILATINPALTTFKPLDIKPVAELGCCQDTSTTCSAKSKTDCKGSWKSGYTCGSKGKCETPSQSYKAAEAACSAINTAAECEKKSDCIWGYLNETTQGCTLRSPSTQPDFCSTAATGAPCNGGKGYCDNKICNSCKNIGDTCGGSGIIWGNSYECKNSSGLCGTASHGSCKIGSTRNWCE